MKALGWEIGDECYSIEFFTNNTTGKRTVPGSKGTVIGPCTSTTLSDSDQRVRVEFENGMLCNALAKGHLMTVAVWQHKVEQVQRTSCLMIPNTTVTPHMPSKVSVY